MCKEELLQTATSALESLNLGMDCLAQALHGHARHGKKHAWN